MKYHICTQQHTALQVVISSLHYIDIIYTACKPGHTFLCASVWYHSLYACLPTRIKFSQNMSPQIKYSPFSLLCFLHVNQLIYPAAPSIGVFILLKFISPMKFGRSVAPFIHMNKVVFSSCFCATSVLTMHQVFFTLTSRSLQPDSFQI